MSVKKIQYKLYNYYNMKDELEYIKEELAELEELDGVGTVRFDKIPGTRSAGGSIVEGVTLIREKKIDLLNYKASNLERQLNRIDSILDTLPHVHAQILKYCYIERKSEQYVKKLVRLSGREYRVKHDIALNWFISAYDVGFGLAIDEDKEEHEKRLEDELERLEQG